MKNAIKYLKQLKKAVKDKDKAAILKAYDAVQIDHRFYWDKYPEQADLWDELVDKANDILMQ